MRLATLALLFSLSLSANAKLLFEGYSKIEVKGKHVGYVIHKDEVDDMTKQRTVTYFIYQNYAGEISQGAVQVVAKPAAPPALYSGVKMTHWSWVGDEGSISIGEFNKDAITFETVDNKTGEVVEYKSGKTQLQARAIFSAMDTTTLAESNPAKYVTGLNTTYKVFEEETQKYDDHIMKILDTKAFGDLKVSQVSVESGKDRYEVYTTPDGQPFGFRDTDSDRMDYLVNKREEAFGDFGTSEMIKKVFKDVPRGLRNAVSESQGKVSSREIVESFMSLKARLTQEELLKKKQNSKREAATVNSQPGDK